MGSLFRRGVSPRSDGSTGEIHPPVPAGVGYAIIGGFLLLCGYYAYVHRDEFGFLREASLGQICAAGLFVLLSMAISALQLGLFLKSFRVRLWFGELMAVTMGVALGNFVIPMRGGSGGLAVYLKKIHSLDYHKFLAIFGGTGLMAVLVNSALALIGLVLVGWTHGFFHLSLTLVTLGMFSFSLYLCLFPPPVTWKGRGLLNFAFSSANAWHRLTRDRHLLFWLALTFLGISLALCAAFWLIYDALGKTLPLSAVLITCSLGNIANIIPITPGSLGIFDVVTIEIPRIFGLDTARSLSATLIFRAVWFWWGLSLGIPGLLYMLRRSPGIPTDGGSRKPSSDNSRDR